MILILFILLPLCTTSTVLFTAPSSVSAPIPAGQKFALQTPQPVLCNIPFALQVTLPALNCHDNVCASWPKNLPFHLATSGGNFTGNFLNVTSFSGLGNGLSFIVKGVTAIEAGYGRLTLTVLPQQQPQPPQPPVPRAPTAPTAPPMPPCPPDQTCSASTSASIFVIPPIFSVFPPVITLILAVCTKQVLPSLLIGVWSGAFLTANYNPVTAFCTTFSRYFVGALTDNGHGPVILFACILGGVLELVDKSGGANGLAEKARKLASTRMRALLCAWALSVLVFFDDYSAILIVGSMLKDSLKKVRMSPAKLAFIIHIVGVNLPSIMPVSSWVGVELGYISDSYSALHLEHDHGTFSVFLRTIPYRFFPILAIVYPLISILLRRDFGSLLQAERDFLQLIAEEIKNIPNDTENSLVAQLLHSATGGSSTSFSRNTTTEGNEEVQANRGGQQQYVQHSQHHILHAQPPLPPLYDSSSSSMEMESNSAAVQGWWPNAVVPFSVIVVVTFAGIIVSGMAQAPGLHPTLIDIVANADSVDALLWSAAAASAVAMIMYGTCQRIMNLENLVAAWTKGFCEMMEPLLILMLAWALGAVVNELQTSVFLSSMLSGSLEVCWLPAIATLLAGLVSFASGSAMGTMGILFPLVLPLAHSLGNEADVMQAAGAVFAGSTFGNTGSPIADNTVLSSIATNCDLVVHAQTMLPSSCLIFVVSIVFGTIPVSLGWYNPAIGLLLSIGVLCIFLLVVGEDVETGAKGCRGICCQRQEEQ